MNNSQRIKVAQQGDFVTITEGNQNPGASFGVVELATQGAALYVDSGVINSVSPSPISGISARIYDRQAPLWTELLFGDQVREVASRVAEGGEGEDVVVEYAEPRTAWGVKRVAQGLWMRRYWPASRERNIPATATELLDLELGALLCEPYVGTCFSDYLVETLLLPRREKAIELAAQLGDMPDAIFERLRGLLIVVLEWYLEQAEEGEDASEEETEQLLSELENALAQVEDAERTSGEYPGLTLTSGVQSRSEGARLQSPDMYALTASGSVGGDHVPAPGGYGRESRPVGETSVDWRQNVHGLIDAASAVYWSGDGNGGTTVWVNPQCPEEPLHGEVWARVYSKVPTLRHLPQVKRMNLNSEAGRIEANFNMPPLRVRLADVYSVPEYGPALEGDARTRQKVDQSKSMEWAANRIARAKRTVANASNSLDSEADGALLEWQSARSLDDLEIPWIAELDAVVKDASSQDASPERSH